MIFFYLWGKHLRNLFLINHIIKISLQDLYKSLSKLSNNKNEDDISDKNLTKHHVADLWGKNLRNLFWTNNKIKITLRNLYTNLS